MEKNRRRRHGSRKAKETVMLFNKKNYLFMLAGFALVSFGFLIMRLENEINGFISLFIAPWIIFAGFLTFGYGIIVKTTELQPDKG